MENLLKIENLKLAFHGPFGRVPAVRGVDFSVDAERRWPWWENPAAARPPSAARF